MKVYKDANGRLWPYPLSVEEAKRNRVPLYTAAEKCPECSMSQTRYVVSGRCLSCSKQITTTAYELWHGACTIEGGKVWPKPVFGRRVTASPISPANERLVYEFLEKCLPFAQGPAPFPHSKTGAFNVKPRPAEPGDTTYFTGDECPRGHLAERDVETGQCLECTPENVVPDGNEVYDLGNGEFAYKISRDDAVLLDLKHYFTGKACKWGHTAPRFVSTRGCVECLREAQRKS